MNIKKAREQFDEVYRLIKEQSPPHHFEFSDPFWVLITTILSHRTKDEVTDPAARRLHDRYHDSRGLESADYDEVYGAISKVGFAKVKAERVIGAARIINEKFGGEVPENIEDMMTIPGIGRKTANVVLADALKIPAIAVDTHVHRISNRIGWSRTKNPDDTEEVLRKIVPREQWLGFNPVLVEFGKTVCKPIGPRCEECLINSYCEYYAANKGKEPMKGSKKTAAKKPVKS